MRIAFLAHEGMDIPRLIAKIEELLKPLGHEAETMLVTYDKKKNDRLDLRGKDIDLFVTFNLDGFEQNTLMGGISYNLFDCKQIHILLDRELPNEKYLEKQLSISMFFYCTGKDYYEYLLGKYPDIPWLEEVGGWKMGASEKSTEESAVKLHELIIKTANICHLL